MTDTEYIRNVIKGYLSSNRAVDINFLSKKDGAITIGTNGQIQEVFYFSGRKVTKQFVITSTQKFSQDITKQKQIYTFFDGLLNYIRLNFDKVNWDGNHQPLAVEIVNSGMIVQSENDLAKWQLTFKLTYYENN